MKERSRGNTDEKEETVEGGRKMRKGKEAEKIDGRRDIEGKQRRGRDITKKGRRGGRRQEKAGARGDIEGNRGMVRQNEERERRQEKNRREGGEPFGYGHWKGGGGVGGLDFR